MTANTTVAKTGNAIIEILLGIISLSKTLVSYFFDQVLTKQINNTPFDVMSMENSILHQIDYFIFPLLIINGFALLLCTVHSYWIDKYNDGKEITWDDELCQKYISER